MGKHLLKNLLSIKFTFCDRIYKCLKFCEKLSGKSKEIEKVQQQIHEEVQNARRVEKELDEVEKVVLTKDEQIRRLLLFINYVAINFRADNYQEVDRLLKEINL